MATSSSNLRVRISADLADIKQGLGLLRGELAKVKRQADVSFGNQNALVNGLRAARQQLVGFVGAYLSLRGVGVLSGIADEATQIRGRIRAAKGDYEAILRIAQATRSGLAATTDLYARMERSTRGMGLGQERLLSLTTAVNQAIRLSYTSAASGEAAVMQFGQALAAGELRGQELNSVLEQTNRLAEAVASGMGIQVGKLKEMAKEGKLTAEEVLRAVESQAQTLGKEFAELPVTIGDSMTVVRNAFVDYIGDVDEAEGASRRLAETLQEFAAELPRYLDPLLTAIRALIQNLDVLIVYLGTRLAAGAIAAAVAGFIRLRAAIEAAKAATITLRVALLALGGPVGVAIAALAAGIYLLYQRTNQARQAAEEHSRALDENERLSRESASAALAEASAKRAQAIQTLAAARAILEEKRARLSAEAGAQGPIGIAKDSTGLRLGGMGREVLQAQANVDAAIARVEDWTGRVAELSVEAAFEFNRAGAAAAAAAGAIADGSEDAKKKVRGVVDELELLQDAARRALDELERRFEAGETGIAEYFGRKRELELQAIDTAIRQAQEEARVAKTSEQQSKALTEIIKLQRDRAEIGPRVAREQAEAEREVTAALEQLRIRLLEAQGQDFQAAAERIRAEFREVLEKLPQDMRPVGQAIVDQIIPLELSKARLQSFQTAMQDAMTQLRMAETSISAQQQAGLLGMGEAERQISAERQKALETLRQLREAVVAYYQATKDPSVIPFLRELNGTIAETVSAQQLFRQQLEDAGRGALSTFFQDLARDVNGAGEALRQLGLNLAQALAQIASAELSKRLVSAISGLFSKGQSKDADVAAGAAALTAAAGATGIAGGVVLTAANALQAAAVQLASSATLLFAANATGGVFHSGGIVGRGGTIRTGISPLVFGLAPRYHSGGIAGLKPNETGAILQLGEEVLTAKDPRHRNNLRSGGQRPTRLIFVDDQRRVADFLNTPEGEDAVVEILGRNPGRVREILA